MPKNAPVGGPHKTSPKQKPTHLPGDPAAAIAMLTEMAGPNGSVAIFGSVESEAEEAVNAVSSGVATTTVEEFLDMAKHNFDGARNTFVVIRVGCTVNQPAFREGLA